MRSVGDEIVQCTICGGRMREGIPHDCKIEATKKGLKFDGRDNDGTEMKLRYDLIPWECIEELAKIFTFGAKKYSDNTWQNVEDFENRYWSALQRHLIAHRRGELRDIETGEFHLSHALWNVVALLWKELRKTPDEQITLENFNRIVNKI